MVLKIGFNELKSHNRDEVINQAVVKLIENVHGSIERNSDKEYISIIPADFVNLRIAIRELAPFVNLGDVRLEQY